MSGAVALGFSLVANLGDNRQMTCQAHVPVDAAPAEINAVIDKVQAVLDRQQARYQIKEHRAELETHVNTYRQMEVDLADAELRYNQAKDGDNKRLVEIGQLIAPMQNASTRKALEAERNQLKAKREGADAERHQYISQILTSKETFEKRIDALKAKIADCETLIG